MTTYLYQGQELGVVPPTPLTPVFADDLTAVASATLFDAAQAFGHPVGYAQEQNGNLIQNILPNQKTEYAQISTSSKGTLALHTETCFHPYLPDFVLLLCLRGDPQAATTYADLSDILGHLSDRTITVLRQPWFRTSVDESFRTKGEPDSPINLSVLTKKTNNTYQLKYDQSVMVGINEDAATALLTLQKAIDDCTKEVVLSTGDLFVMDNSDTIHGRKPFQARYDGTDRWLQRLLVRTTVDNIPHTRLCPKTHCTVITEYR